MNNMSRFLSKREKDGRTHRRDKSRDKSAEKKVMFTHVSFYFSLIPRKMPTASDTMVSTSAAFTIHHGKSTAHLQTSYLRPILQVLIITLVFPADEAE